MIYKFSPFIFLLWLFCAIGQPVLAQFNSKEQHVSWYLGAGGSHFRPDWKDMQLFADSYNSYYADKLTTPFTPMQAKYTPRIETGLFLGNMIDVGIAYTLPAQYNMKATFQNGESREFKLVTSQTELNFDLNLFHIKKFFFGVNMSALFVKGNLHSGYRYGNDFVSYGTEKRMNGIFKTDDTQLSGGAQLYFLPHKNLSIVAQWQYCGLWRNLVLGKTDVLGMKDMIDGYGGQYSNHQ